MNTAFKVVFNRARRALMVVNEVTSSVQAKGTKTVVVAAVASLLAGGAVAADKPFTVNDGQKSAENIITNTEVENDLTVIANSKTADATGYYVMKEGVTFTNKGKITITGQNEAKSWKQEGILTDHKATAVNEGKIIATNAYGMKVGTIEASTIINNGEITVSGEGVGMELGGADKSKAINNKTITVIDKTGQFAVGVLVKGTSNVTFENNGTISATAEGMKAISVEKDGQNTADASMTFGEKSKVEGLISLDEGTTTDLTFKGAKDTLTIASKGTATLTLTDGAGITLADNQNSVYDNVDIQSGTLNASIFQSGNTLDNHFKAVTIGQEGTFNIKALNSKKAPKSDKENNQLFLNDLQLTLDGGHLQVGGSDYQGDLKIGSSPIASSLTINRGDYTFGKVFFGSSNSADKKSSLTMKDGNLTVQTLDFTTGDVAISGGVLTANQLAWDATGKTYHKKGELTISENGTVALMGAGKDAKDIAGSIKVTGNGVLTTNKDAVAGEKSGATFYIDRPVTLAAGTEITIGGEEKAAEASKQANATPADASPTADASTADTAMVSVNKGGKVVIDAAKLGENNTALAETNLTVNDEGELQIKNVTSLGTIKVAKSLTGDVTTDSRFIGATLKGGNVVFAAKEDVTGDEVLDARMKERLEAGLSNKETEILGTLNGDAFADKDKLSAALEQAAGGNATAGVLNVAYDANAQVTDAIVRHQLSEHNGKGLWADVFYAKNEAKEIYGNSGYSADIYGGVIGLDGTFSCGATGGVALTIGTADADSKGGVFSTSLDSDFWGVSAYAVKPMGGFNVKADIGYLHFDNDFTGVGDASDASSVTVGLRADYTAFQKGVFSITPHAGIRYTHIDTDAVAFNDDQKMNIVETPVGVTFAGNFETTGWTIVPSYDFTIVPQLADKEVEAFGSADDMKILNGGLYNNVLGVQAQKGNVSFGLHAAYGFGSNDRSNTQVNVNVRYTF